MKKVLVTGGLGFIGSHTVVNLIEEKYDVVIIDNLFNSKLEVLDRIEQITGVRPKFYQFDVQNIFEFLHAVCGYIFDMRDPGVMHRDIFRVDYVYRSVRSCVSVQTCGRIYLKGCPHDKHYVCRLHRVNGFLYFRDRLPEPYDVRTELRPVRGLVAQVYLSVAYVEDARF